MNRFRGITILAVAGVLAFGSTAFAQAPAGRRGGAAGIQRGLGGGRGRLALGLAARELNLSDAQRQQMRAIVMGARQESRPLAERMREAMEARRKAMTASPVDESQIRQTTAALAAAQADLAVARAHVRSDIMALLTPEQQAKASELQANRAARLQERKNRQQQRNP